MRQLGLLVLRRRRSSGLTEDDIHDSLAGFGKANKIIGCSPQDDIRTGLEKTAERAGSKRLSL